MKKLLIASTSTLNGSAYLAYLLDELTVFFQSTETIVFIPYARPSGLSHDAYTKIAETAFQKINKKIVGLHEFDDPIQALKDAEGIFVGGGNSFVLVDQLHRKNIMNTLRSVVNSGTPYLGTSAGSNICGISMGTSNDMPIVHPSSFETLGIIPFNINPHYLDPLPESKHMGETRATRIKEFHFFNTQAVVGLREGSFLEVIGEQIVLKGPLNARVFEHHKAPYEISSGTDLSDLH